MAHEESDHHKEVYAHAGLALYKAQCLEFEVCNFLVLHELATNRTITAEERDAFISRAERQTLGALLRELGTVINAPVDFQDLLADALEKRNFFIHRYFSERIGNFVTPDGLDRMIIELQSLVSLFDRADKSVGSFTSVARRTLGISDEHVRRTAEELYGNLVAEKLFRQNGAI